MKSLITNYGEYYEKVSFIPQQTDQEELQHFLLLVNNVGQKLKILDVGCAEGKLSTLLAKNGHDVTAADISNSFLEKTKKLAQKENVILKTISCNIEEDISIFGTDKYDLILFMDILEHVCSPSKAILNIRFLLKENGYLWVYPDFPKGLTL